MLSQFISHELLTQIPCRFPGASSQGILLELVKRIGRGYFKGKRSANFPIDLLRVGIPSVFMVRVIERRPVPPDKIAAAEFTSEIQDYIKRCRVKLQLLGRMKEIVVCACLLKA